MKEKIKAKFSDGRFAASLIIISAICLFAGFMTQMTYAFLGSLWLMISGCTLLICSVVEKAVKDLKKEAHDEDH